MNIPTLRLPYYTYRVEVVKVIDADTIDVKIDVGFNTHIFKRLRFLGVDTWEVRGDEREKGLIAKARLEELIASSKEAYIQTVMDGQGKYGRVLAWFWLGHDNGIYECANRILLEEGHGVES